MINFPVGVPLIMDAHLFCRTAIEEFESASSAVGKLQQAFDDY
jgi:hypothetical protein